MNAEFYEKHWERLVRARAEMATSEKHIYETLLALRKEAQSSGHFPNGSQGKVEDFAFFDLFYDTIAEFLTDAATSDLLLREALSDLDRRAALTGWRRIRRDNLAKRTNDPCSGCGQGLVPVCVVNDCGGQLRGSVPTPLARPEPTTRCPHGYSIAVGCCSYCPPNAGGYHGNAFEKDEARYKQPMSI